MLALTLVVVSIAIADSVNRSTVVPALWQAGAPRGRGLASFTLGVFTVYLAAGVALAFGPCASAGGRGGFRGSRGGAMATT